MGDDEGCVERYCRERGVDIDKWSEKRREIH
jgi:hypothetical protein